MSQRQPHASSRRVSFALDESPVIVRRRSSVEDDQNDRRSRMEYVRQRSRSRSEPRESRNQGQERSPAPPEYRYVVASHGRGHGERQMESVQPSSANPPVPGAWVPRSPIIYQDAEYRGRSPQREIFYERLHRSQFRTSRPPVEATAADLFRYFQNTPSPEHLRAQPKEAMIWKWHDWLVEVRHVESENAWPMARMYVDERWHEAERDVKGTSRFSENPYRQQQGQGQMRDSRMHQQDHVIERQKTKQEMDPALHLHRHHTDGEITSRGRSCERRVHWADSERPQVQVSANQLRSWQNNRGMSPTSSRIPELRRIGPRHEHQEGTADDPWLNATNTTSANDSARTDWNHVRYVPEKTLQTLPSSFSDRSRDPGVAFIEGNLIKAIKEALKATPDAYGSDLFLDPRLRIPMPVAQSIARGELDGDTSDLFSSLFEINAFVPTPSRENLEIAASRGPSSGSEGYREVVREFHRTTSQEDNNRGRIRYISPERIAREEQMGWEQVREPRPRWY